LSDLSGATADVGTPYSEGIRGYVAQLNDDGGIDGRKIELKLDDYAYDVAKAEQLYSQYVNEGAVAIQGWGTGDTEALRQKVTQDELPFMSASYAATLIDPKEAPYNFVVATTYSDQMRIALKWIAEDAGGAAEVAVFHHDSPFGLSPVEDGGTYIEEEGLDLGYEPYAMPTGATDYVGLLSRAKSQGANYIVIQNVSSPAAVVAKNIAQQGLDMKIVCLNWCSDENFIELAGDASAGHVMVQPYTPPSVTVEGHDPVNAFLESDGKSLDDKGLHYVQGWYTMHVMAEGIRKVVEDGDEVTGPAIKKALEAIDPVDTGEVTSPIDFSADSHAGMQQSGVYVVENGAMAELAPQSSP
ncbi:MAG: ABC transporter substrate-binding protein, partial [Actinomycetes bacterium]